MIALPQADRRLAAKDRVSRREEGSQPFGKRRQIAAAGQHGIEARSFGIGKGTGKATERAEIASRAILDAFEPRPMSTDDDHGLAFRRQCPRDVIEHRQTLDPGERLVAAEAPGLPAREDRAQEPQTLRPAAAWTIGAADRCWSETSAMKEFAP
jgi:hypothetical protein